MRSFPKNSVLLLVAFAVLLQSGCTQQARKTRALAKADKYFAASDYSQAEIEYRNVIKLDPDDVNAYSRLGLIYFEEGRLSRAYPFLKRAQEMDANNLQTRLKLGLVQLATGDVKAARDQALFVLEKDSKFPDAAPLLAQTIKTPKDAETIRQHLEKLAAQNGATAETELAFGILILQAGKLDEAQTRFAHAQSLDPKSAGAWFAAGSVAWSQNNVTNADLLLKQAAELSPVRSPHRLSYANFKLKTGAVEEGKQLLKDITKAAPDCLPAWLALADVVIAQKQFAEGARLISQVQARDPENYQAQMLTARSKLVQGQAQEAIADYERLARRFNRSPQNFFQLGIAYLASGDNARALKNFNEAISLDPNFDDAILMQAQLNTQRDDPDSAIKALVPLIQKRPQLDSAYLYLAGAYATKNDFANAIATCRRLEKLHPDSPQVPFVIGGFLLQQDKIKEARQEFTRARKMSPDFQPAFQQLVALDIHDKNFQSALTAVQGEIDRHPTLPELRALRASVLIAQTNLDEAEVNLRKAIELNADYRPAYMMLADLYVNSKKTEKALDELNQFVAKKPNDIPALLLIGMIHNDRGNFAEARAAYERLLSVNPTFGIALNNLAYLYSEQFGLLDKAYETARKARDLAPSDPAAADTLGWILFKRGDYSWATSLLQSSAEKLPGEPEVLYHLGMTYYMMNDELRASNAFKRAMSSAKDFPGKEEVRKRLALLSLNFSDAGTNVAAVLEQRLKDQPDDPVALTRLAATYERQGAREKAAQLYEQVIKQNSSNPKSLVNLARLYADHLNNQPKALELAKAAYKLAPDDVDVAHVLGRLVFAAGQYKYALTLLQQGDAQRSADTGLLYDLALAFYSMGQVEDAETAMRNAILSNANFGRAKEANQFLELIALANDPAKADGASSQIQQALKADPGNVAGLMASAAASEHRADMAAANTLLEQALLRYPDFTPAAKKLARNYSEIPDKTQRAYELAVKAREVSPNDPGVARTLGIVYYQRGDYSGAVRFLNQSMQAPETVDGKTYFYLGMAHFKLKHPRESKGALQQALAKTLPKLQADEATATLAQIK